MRVLIAIAFLLPVQIFAQPTTDYTVKGRTTGKLPQVAYGLGDDRLGGAKMGYIDTSVLVNIADSINDQYLLQLSAYHKAYINKNFIRLDSGGRPPLGGYLTGSFLITGDDKFDYLDIHLNEKLPYKTWMETNPSKIELLIYGVQCNTNWITQKRSAGEIKEVSLQQPEDDVVKVTINLLHNQHWGYSVFYSGNNLIIRVRHKPKNLSIKNLSIAIDAGHGGTNSGAKGVNTNTYEKLYTLRFAEELQRLLRHKGARVTMTRTADTTINNVDRVIQLQQIIPDVAISLHLNSSGRATASGVSTYYKHIGFKQLSTNILDKMLDLNLNEFGNVGNFNFALNAPTDYPNCLVEIAFLSNAVDEKKIVDPRFQKSVAVKIYRGIKQWLRSAGQ